MLHSNRPSAGWFPHWVWLSGPEARPERLAFLLLLVSAGTWGSQTLPLALQTFLGVAVLVALAVLLRRGVARLLGPMFFYDLLCTARRGRQLALRCLYAVVLLGAIFTVYANWFGVGSFGQPLPQDQLARFATSFFTTFLGTQLLAVLVLTPAFTAGAIAEEKQRRRLDFLLATDLRNHEIVLGKLVSRLAAVGLLLITGLPVLALMQFLGGVDPNLVLAGFAITLLTMLSVGSIGILASTLYSKPSGAMWQTYLLVLLYFGTCWCMPVINWGHPGAVYATLEGSLNANQDIASVLWKEVAAYAYFHGMVAAGAALLAMYSLRPHWSWDPGVLAVAPPALPLPPQEFDALGDGPASPENVSTQATAPPPVLVRYAPVPIHPPIGDNPLLWKELYLDQDDSHEGLKALVLIGSLFVGLIASMVCLAVILQALESGTPLADVTNPMARFLGTTLGCFMLLGILFTSVATISRERDQRTLDSLLTLPIRRTDVLRAKWLGSILSVRRLGWGLAAIWGLAAATGGLHVLALPLLIFGWLAYAAFAASLGLWCSIVSATKVQATMRALVICFAVMLTSILVDKMFFMCTTPIGTLWLLVVGGRDFDPSRRHSDYGLTHPAELLLPMAGVSCYALAASILWFASCRSFRKEMGPPPAAPAAKPQSAQPTVLDHLPEAGA
jgi:ABC-type transport system involved in multi-copper enzyme maturation permease subunit